MRVNEASQSDNDFKEIVIELLQNAKENIAHDVESGIDTDEVYLSLDEAISSVNALCGDNYLSYKINEEDSIGYSPYKNAASNNGIAITELAAFCTTELRLRSLKLFLKKKYPDSVLREREDTRMRFEVPSEGIKISSLFKTIEENKDRLFVAEYGISQTTLEQGKYN